MASRVSRRRASGGATLLELVIVIALTAIMAGALAMFISRPLEGYHDLTVRATLVNVAEGALRRTARDVRRGLPNSLRVAGGGQALELLDVADGARYRLRPGIDPGGYSHTGPDDRLSFTPPGDAKFDVLGRLAALSSTYGTPLPAPLPGARVVVYPTNAPALYADAATGATPGVITPAGTTVTVATNGDEDQIALSAPFQFAFESPNQRLYVVDTPVSYLCDLGAGTLTRYWGYSVSSAQPTDPAAAPLNAGSSALVTNHVTSCQFTYVPGSPDRAALVTATIGLSQAGESVQLLEQIHVENVP